MTCTSVGNGITPPTPRTIVCQSYTHTNPKKALSVTGTGTMMQLHATATPASATCVRRMSRMLEPSTHVSCSA